MTDISFEMKEKSKYKTLDEAFRYYQKIDTENEKLKAENARLRSALEFYAGWLEYGMYEGELLMRKLGRNDKFLNVHEVAQKALGKGSSDE